MKVVTLTIESLHFEATGLTELILCLKKLGHNITGCLPYRLLVWFGYKGYLLK